MPVYKTTSGDARFLAMHRPSGEDPATYTTPATKRFDAKHQHIPICNELAAMVERDAMANVCRVKNATGGALAKGDLVRVADLALTAQTTATSTSSPSAGSSVVLLLAATFEVGQCVTVASGGVTEYCLVTAISGGVSVTVDILNYSHTTPTVTALPAYEIVLADADNTSGANLVLASSLSNGDYGWAFGEVEISGIDTSGFTAEEILYLSTTGTTGNTLTGTAPVGLDVIQQEVGVVKTVHASTGKVHFFPGRRRIVKVGDSFLQSTGTITYAGPKLTWYKITVGYAAIQTAATTNEYTFATLPIKGKVHACFRKHSTAFTGGAISAVTVQLGINGATDKYAPNFDIFQAVGNTVFAEDDLGPGGILESWTATTALKALFTSTGANLSALTAGSVDIYVLVSVLP